MIEHTHEPAYRAALETAYSDLDQICKRLAELRANKEVIEKALDALRGIVDMSAPVAEIAQPMAVSAPPPTPAPVAPAPVYEFTPRSVPVPPAADPFAPAPRREQPAAIVPGSDLESHINHALGLAAMA